MWVKKYVEMRKILFKTENNCLKTQTKHSLINLAYLFCTWEPGFLGSQCCLLDILFVIWTGL